MSKIKVINTYRVMEMKARMKTVLVDDDTVMVSELENLLELYRSFEVTARFGDVNEAMDYLTSHEADVMFVRLAIGNPMYSGDGSFMVGILSMQKPDLLIVPYSENPGDAYPAQNFGATAFLTVPVEVTDIQRLVCRLEYLFDLICTKRESRDQSLMVKNKLGYQMVRLCDILYIESSNRRKRMICSNGNEIEILNYTMDELAELLAGGPFFRCYQSFIVNLRKITAIRTDAAKRSYGIMLEGYEEEILLSREKQKEIITLLQQRYSDISL